MEDTAHWQDLDQWALGLVAKRPLVSDSIMDEYYQLTSMELDFFPDGTMTVMTLFALHMKIADRLCLKYIELGQQNEATQVAFAFTIGVAQSYLMERQEGMGPTTDTLIDPQ